MLKIVLLPGMDGTGKLFSGLIVELPSCCETVVVTYPTDRYLCALETADLIRSFCPVSGPFVLLAESFSVPMRDSLRRFQPFKHEGIDNLRRIRSQSHTRLETSYRLFTCTNPISWMDAKISSQALAPWTGSVASLVVGGAQGDHRSQAAGAGRAPPLRNRL